MKFELKEVEELDQEIRFEIWIDGECHKAYSKNRLQDPKAAAQLEYNRMLERARAGYPKTTVVQTDDVPANKNKVTPKNKKNDKKS